MTGTAIPLRFAAPLTALLLAACGGIVPDGRDGGITPRSASHRATGPVDPAGQQCLARLSDEGHRFTPLPDRYDGAGCGLRNAVTLGPVKGDLTVLDVTRLGPVACPTAQAFTAWVRFGVDRAAREMLGSPVRAVETMGSYACRNVAGSTRRSAHATADAIDVAAFVLADGRRISVKDSWDAGGKSERAFLRTVQASACKRFGTVLGPGYNAAHRDHFHLERGGAGGFCR